MNKNYTFSPIKDPQTLFAAAQYTAQELTALSAKLLNEKLPIKSIKIFAHYPGEFETIKNLLLKLGSPDLETHTSFYIRLKAPLAYKDQHISLLGVRISDPYRSQIGCGDFVITEPYERFEAKFIKDTDPTRNIRHAIGHTLNMIELWHPDSEVLGYVLAPESDWTRIKQ